MCGIATVKQAQTFSLYVTMPQSRCPELSDAYVLLLLRNHICEIEVGCSVYTVERTLHEPRVGSSTKSSYLMKFD